MGDNTDTYDEISPPKHLYLIGTPAVLVAFVGTACIRQDAAPLFAAFSMGVLCLLIGLTWQLRHRKMLWVLLAGIALLHSTAIIAIRFPEKISYGMLFAPMIGIDAYVSWKLIIFTLKSLD